MRSAPGRAGCPDGRRCTVPPVSGAERLRGFPKRYLVVAPMAVVAVLAVTAASVDVRPVLAVVALMLVALSCWTDDRRLAWWWGFLLPIDFVTGVSPHIFDVARYGAVVWIAWRFKPDLSTDGRRYVLKLAALVAAVAAIKELGSLARSDHFGIFIAFVMGVGAVTAPIIAFRVRAHRSILAGFLGGTVLTAVVSIMQALDLPTLMTGNQVGSRFPGLASTTMLITWELAFGLMIAAYFLSGHRHRRVDRAVAVVAVPTCLVAFVGNGAQGGLLGLVAAGAIVAFRARGRVRWGSVARYVYGAVAIAVVVVAVTVLVGVKTPTISGLFGQGGYRNEIGRLEVDRQGVHELIARPLFGIGRTNFQHRHALDLAPHFLPLEAGVTSGIVGFLVALYLLYYLLVLVLRGPIGRRPSAWLGLALAAAMWSNTLTETGGPFTGLPRFSLLLIAVLACMGEPWPVDGEPPRSEEARSREPEVEVGPEADHGDPIRPAISEPVHRSEAAEGRAGS